jgi:type II secretory pathway pseudopilin PulG
MLTQIAIVLAAKTQPSALSPEVLIALIGVFGTLAAAIASSVLTNRASVRRETLQWQRTVREQQRQAALNICEDYATVTSAMMLSGNTDSEGILRNMNRVQLHTSEPIAIAARELYDLSVKAQETRAQFETEAEKEREKGGQNIPAEEIAEYRKAVEAVRRKRDEFIRIAREKYSQTEDSYHRSNVVPDVPTHR